MAADLSQERKNRLDVSRPTSQPVVEFVEDQDFGLQAVEEMIKLLRRSGRSTQRLQDASIKMGKSGALTRLTRCCSVAFKCSTTNRSAIIILPLA